MTTTENNKPNSLSLARPLAEHLFDCLVMDTWPRAAAVCDWGIESPRNLGALQAAVRAGATAADLDEVCGDGPAIMKFVKHWAPTSFYAATRFVTSFDNIPSEDH